MLKAVLLSFEFGCVFGCFYIPGLILDEDPKKLVCCAYVRAQRNTIEAMNVMEGNRPLVCLITSDETWFRVQGLRGGAGNHLHILLPYLLSLEISRLPPSSLICLAINSVTIVHQDE